jgi:hypothetical protein
MQGADEEPVELESLEIDGADTLDTPRAPVKPAKETNKRLVALITAIIIIVLIAGGLAIYTFLLHSNPSLSTSTTPNTPPVSTLEKLTAKTLVAKAKVVMKGDAKETGLNADGTPYNVFSAPPFQPTSYNFSVRADKEYGFGSYGTKSVITSDLTAIQKVLTDNNLKGTVLDPGSDVGEYAAQYESADIVCSVSDQKPSNQSATNTNYSTTLGCADKSSYLTNAAMLRPYFIVYASQSQFDSTHTLMSTPTLKVSKTAGYSTSTVAISGSVYGSVGGFAGLFYVTPDKVLHYFTGTQNELPCSKYSTDDLKKAYLGEQCYDEATHNDTATVTL